MDLACSSYIWSLLCFTSFNWGILVAKDLLYEWMLIPGDLVPKKIITCVRQKSSLNKLKFVSTVWNLTIPDGLWWMLLLHVINFQLFKECNMVVFHVIRQKGSSHINKMQSFNQLEKVICTTYCKTHNSLELMLGIRCFHTHWGEKCYVPCMFHGHVPC